MDARNTGSQPLRLHLAAGQLLASVDSTIVVLKSQTLDFAPRSERHEQFATVATSSANKVAGAEFHLSSGTLPDWTSSSLMSPRIRPSIRPPSRPPPSSSRKTCRFPRSRSSIN